MGAVDARAFRRSAAGTAPRISHVERDRIGARLHADRRRRIRLPHRPRLPGAASLHARALRDDVSRAALDDAPDRRLRNGRRHERPLQVPDRARPNRNLDRFRHADAHGIRQRRSAQRRRGGTRGRRDRHRRRHARPLSRHRSREYLGLDDHQPVGLDPACDVPRRRRRARLRLEETLRNRPERHRQGIHLAKRVGLSAAARDAPRTRQHRLQREASSSLQSRERQRLSYARSRLDGDSGGRLHLGGRHRVRRRRHQVRSRSSARHGACGPRS